MNRLVALLAILLACLAISVQAQTPFGTGGLCTQAGPYPWIENGCVNTSDLNNALELSIGSTPPQNGQGQGAGQGKVWLDTSISPARIRICAVASPGRCSPTYNAGDWIELTAVDLGGQQIDWPIGGGSASVPAAAIVDLGLYPQSALTITGAATISSFGTRLPVGQSKYLYFTGAATLHYNSAQIITPGLADITTASGDAALVTSLGGGKYSVLYTRH